MLPSQKFHCLLDELPLHLIPKHSWDREGNDSSQALRINPACSIMRSGEIPFELREYARLLDGFSLDTATAWVRDPATGSLEPFWLGPQFERIISQLTAREISADSLPRKALAVLTRAGILTTEDESKKRIAEWETIRSHGAQMFRERDYCPLRNMIHPFNLAALRRYYRNAIRRGTISLGDEQSSRRYVAHNEPVARFFQHQIANIVSAIVGEPVKPSYVYFASYLEGAELKKHTDREQCEFSVTLCLDFSPEPEMATSWPICLDTPTGAIAIYQALGDGLVYRGTKVPHYRSALAAGHTSTSIFFHYVPADFSGPLD